MADVLDRIQKLLALTASPNENEARNAAFLAAKMIREHKVQLSLERAIPTVPLTADMDNFWQGWGGRPRRPRGRSREPAPDETRKDAYGREWGFYAYSPIEGNCTYCGKWVYRAVPVLRRQEDYELQHERCWEVSNPRKAKPNAKDFDISAEELDELFK